MSKNEQHQDGDTLTAKQQAAIPHLVANATGTAGVEAAQIGRATLTRWMNDDRFRIELTRKREEAAELAFAELQGLMLHSIEVLAESLVGHNETNRVNAARITLNTAIRANDSRVLRRRLDIIEDGLTNLKAQR